jgi:hypothetical protein
VQLLAVGREGLVIYYQAAGHTLQSHYHPMVHRCNARLWKLQDPAVRQSKPPRSPAQTKIASNISDLYSYPASYGNSVAVESFAISNT